MEKCVFYNGENCTYEDYASGQTEDGDCKKKGKKGRCSSYSEKQEKDED